MAWISFLAMTALWTLVGVGGPRLVPSGSNKILFQTMIVMSAVCCYTFWLVVFLHQLNPLIGPQIPVKTIAWLGEKWGNAPTLIGK